MTLVAEASNGSDAVTNAGFRPVHERAPPIRVMSVEDHQLMRQGIATMILDQPETRKRGGARRYIG